VQGAVVDVGARKLVIEPTTDPVLEGTASGRDVYLRIGTTESAQELRSYAIDGGKLRWSVTLLERGKAPGMPPDQFCRDLAAGPAGVFCVTNRGVRYFAAADGAASDAISSDRVHTIERLGDRIVVLSSGGSSCTDRCIESGIVEVIDAATGEALAKPPKGAGGPPRQLGFRPQNFPGPAGNQTFAPRAQELCVFSTWAWPVSGGVTRDNLDVNCFSGALMPRIEVRDRFAGAELKPVQADRSWVVVANTGKGAQSYLVDLEKGAVRESSVPVAAVVANDAGSIDALVVPPKVLELSGNPRFDLAGESKGFFRGLRTKDVIILSRRDPASSSIVVTAVEAMSGSERWRGEVALRPGVPRRDIGSHQLELDGDAVILRGSEWTQVYVAAFAVADGEKLLEVVRSR
jgi:hypothetical protein